MAKKNQKIEVQGLQVSYTSIDNDDFISITDIARLKNAEAPADIIKNWMRNKNTIELLGLWERLNNPDFKLVEFDQFRNEAGYNHFVLSPKKWISSTNAIGLQSKSGRYLPSTPLRHRTMRWLSGVIKRWLSGVETKGDSDE